jgi:hypothetical protein
MLSTATGCAIHLVAPTPDVGRAGVVPPAPTSGLAIVAVVGEAELTSWLTGVTSAPAHFGQSSAIVGSWSLDVARSGKAHAYGRDDEICFDLPFTANGQLEVFGRRLDRALQARVLACAVPRLRANASLAFDSPHVTFHLDGARMEMSSKILATTFGRYLADVAAPAIQAALDHAAVPMAERLQQAAAPLFATVDLGQGACLRLRPQRLVIGQPVVEGRGLRLPSQLDIRPTVEAPCVGASDAAGRRPEPTAETLPVVASPDLRIQKTRLVLPIGVATEQLTASLAQGLRTSGRLRFDRGWVEIVDARLDTAGGLLLVRARVKGELQGKVLGLVPWRRAIDGEVLIWGLPHVQDGVISLADPKLDVRSDDDVGEVAVALQRDGLTKRTAALLRIDTAPMLRQAEATIATMARGLKLGTTVLPIRAVQASLAVERVRGVGGRVVVDVVFVGHIVVGGVQGDSPATSPRPNPLKRPD